MLSVFFFVFFFFGFPQGYILGLFLFPGIIYTIINVLLLLLFSSSSSSSSSIKVISFENITLGKMSVTLDILTNDSTHLLDVCLYFYKEDRLCYFLFAFFVHHFPS